MAEKIPDYPLYTVDEFGNVFSIVSNRLLKPFRTSSGYYTVQLFNEHGHRNFLVHRLVAEAFIPNPDGLSQVNHKDENKQNNYVGNLEWCNAKYNMRYGTGINRRKKSTKWYHQGHEIKETMRKNAQMNRKAVLLFSKDGTLIRTFESITKAAKELSIDGAHISQVCLGKRKSCGGYKFEYVKE